MGVDSFLAYSPSMRSGRPGWHGVGSRTLPVRLASNALSKMTSLAVFPVALMNYATLCTTLLLMDDYSPAYVQKQLGRHSITMTVDIYGHWLPGEGKKDLESPFIYIPPNPVDCSSTPFRD